MSWKGLAVLAAAVTALGGCSLVTGPSEESTTHIPEGATTSIVHVETTIAATTTVPPTTTTAPEVSTTVPVTTTVPATTTTTIYFATADSLYPPESLSSDGASGSGCSPGSGALPSGVWFGYATAGNATSLQFDLACWYFGDLAWEIAATYGETAENDYYVVNQNPTLRTVPVATGAIVHHINASSTAHDPMAYADWLLEPEGYLSCPFDFCPLWLYVNGGEVTEILEQYVP
ncbi:MAG: hypothetical protein ABFR53_07010 [Actinomycetota bacterium]